MSLDEREQRIGRNQAVFREVNERLMTLNADFAELSGVIEVVCECGDLGCVAQVTIPAAGYEDLRADPTWFVVIPGHAVTAVEEIVAQHPGYDIVKKRPGDAALIAKETDPRA